MATKETKAVQGEVVKKDLIFVPLPINSEGKTIEDDKWDRFQHDGQDFYLEKGRMVEVPDWFFEQHPDYLQFKVQR